MRIVSHIAPTPGRLPVAFLGTYPPRACGIATFTNHLVSALNEHGSVQPWVLAVTNDEDAGTRAGDGIVAFELDQHTEADYAAAARFLNASGVVALNVQHEYGIFGGEWGRMLLELLRRVRVPVVTTLHTVLRNPKPEVRRITRAIADLSAGLTVMARSAVRILGEDYGIAPGKVQVIPHGIPDGPYPDPHEAKRAASLEGRTVLSTFGLLSPGKGLEHAIHALPRIVASDPSVLYLIVGQTHPGVLRYEGERYREHLQTLVQDLGVAHAVRFDNRYLTDREILATLAATDVHLTPYLNPAQITSGTLTYAVGSGCPVVSTPYEYAKELITHDHGALVPFRSAEAIADAVVELLGDADRRGAIATAGRRLRGMLRWSSVALSYANVFEAHTRREAVGAAGRGPVLVPLPARR